MRAKKVRAIHAAAMLPVIGATNRRKWRRFWLRQRREKRGGGSPYVATRRTAAELQAAALKRGAAEAAERAAIVRRRPHLADGWVPIQNVPIQNLRRLAAICDLGALLAGKAGAP